MDALADISPIRGLIEQGCDLEADVLPIVAREIPELPRPLKNWGARRGSRKRFLPPATSSLRA